MSTDRSWCRHGASLSSSDSFRRLSQKTRKNIRTRLNYTTQYQSTFHIPEVWQPYVNRGSICRFLIENLSIAVRCIRSKYILHVSATKINRRKNSIQASVRSSSRKRYGKLLVTI